MFSQSPPLLISPLYNNIDSRNFDSFCLSRLAYLITTQYRYIDTFPKTSLPTIIVIQSQDLFSSFYNLPQTGGFAKLRHSTWRQSAIIRQALSLAFICNIFSGILVWRRYLSIWSILYGNSYAARSGCCSRTGFTYMLDSRVEHNHAWSQNNIRLSKPLKVKQGRSVYY